MASGTGRLSDDEWVLLHRLLGMHCEFELDQYDNWIVATSYGDVYVNLTRADPPDEHMSSYRRVPA